MEVAVAAMLFKDPAQVMHMHKSMLNTQTVPSIGIKTILYLLYRKKSSYPNCVNIISFKPFSFFLFQDISSSVASTKFWYAS